jgi:hypothetical protein
LKALVIVKGEGFEGCATQEWTAMRLANRTAGI